MHDASHGNPSHGEATMSPLTYLKQQLNFALTEWTKLNDDEKAWYKAAAESEMRLLGIDVK